MQFIKIFIIAQFLFLCFQFIYFLRLESFQYCELIFGSFFIIIFFGLFGAILTGDMMQEKPTLLNNMSLFATIYAIWFYITKKLSNGINSDRNGVIYY